MNEMPVLGRPTLAQAVKWKIYRLKMAYYANFGGSKERERAVNILMSFPTKQSIKVAI